MGHVFGPGQVQWGHEIGEEYDCRYEFAVDSLPINENYGVKTSEVPRLNGKFVEAMQVETRNHWWVSINPAKRVFEESVSPAPPGVAHDVAQFLAAGLPINGVEQKRGMGAAIEYFALRKAIPVWMVYGLIFGGVVLGGAITVKIVKVFI